MGRAADETFMRAALREAARARGRTAPNPHVGAVVVAGGRRVASGFTRPAGGPHAEVIAIARAGAAAHGATLYVTLEPCAHHGRTPPCLDAVREAGFRRVVIGMRDPDPRTHGKSVRALRRAGLEVTLGVLGSECRETLRGFVSRLERRRPFTRLKLAASLDGRIATRTGESRWISGPLARAEVHRIRAQVDAVVIGSRTAQADDPALTARRGSRVVARPQAVVVDSKLRLSPEARLFAGRARPLVLCARAAPAERRRRLERAGARLVSVRQGRDGHLDLRAAWRALADEGLNEVLVEGGGGLAAALLRAELVDQIDLFLAPALLGGDARPALASLGVAWLDQAVRAPVSKLRRLGPDLWLELDLRARE